MIVEVDGVVYSAPYFPFFRVEQHEDFEVWNLRLPSGSLEEVLVFETQKPLACLTEHVEYLIREYVLEEEIMLTKRALDFKKELEELFCRHES
jgi:hypothetical protein